MSEVGRRLKVLRGSRTLEQVKDATGVDPSQLSKLERGVCGQRYVELLGRLAEGYGVSLASLFLHKPPRRARRSSSVSG